MLKILRKKHQCFSKERECSLVSMLLFEILRPIVRMLALMATCGFCFRLQGRYSGCCLWWLHLATAQDSTDDTVDAVLDMERMLTIARTIVWMLLLEMACPTCPALPCNAAAPLLPERKQWEFWIGMGIGIWDSFLGWELGLVFANMCRNFAIMHSVARRRWGRDLHTNREEGMRQALGDK